MKFLKDFGFGVVKVLLVENNEQMEEDFFLSSDHITSFNNMEYRDEQEDLIRRILNQNEYNYDETKGVIYKVKLTQKERDVKSRFHPGFNLNVIHNYSSLEKEREKSYDLFIIDNE
jgi:hypothetical protein